MKDALRILRYNTGTDKKAFIEFKEQFDAVIFNATIVAYSGSSVADLVSMYKRKYIIDPQTHIFQQDISAIMSENKKTGSRHIKKSVEKYLDQLPKPLAETLIEQKRPLTVQIIRQYMDALISKSFKFQTGYVDQYIEKKDYKKYLNFAKFGPEPKMVIAPYFMLKASYSLPLIDAWLKTNSECLQKTILFAQNSPKSYPIAAQLVLDAEVLLSENFLDKVKYTYSQGDYEYVFIWIDNFNAFEERTEYVKAFAKLIKILNNIGKKPIMAYGGYESIVLCNNQSPCRLYGVAQSVGYGEYMPITPVGGGLPVNKYYFLPLHRRMHFNEAANILTRKNYFTNDKNDLQHAEDYYKYICNCKQCQSVIGNDINNFDKYNDSTPYNINTKNGIVSRNRPTNDAELIAALHFLYCKVTEWDDIENSAFPDIIKKLKDNYQIYCPQMFDQIAKWCSVYEQKKN